jgi:predicted DNA-binding ribbon-helix-helix protein
VEAKPNDAGPRSVTRTPAAGSAQPNPSDGADSLRAGNSTFATPLKRSVTIAGHETSIALEPMFWSALEQAAADSQLPLNALIARIDAERLDQSPPPNLASAIRQWLFVRALSRH